MIRSFISDYLHETVQVASLIDRVAIDHAIDLLRDLKYRNGRLFILGNGGSAANASHAVNDFRKIAGIEAYAPTDNVAELTAWANDVAPDVMFINWLAESRLAATDALLVLSVGGGGPDISHNLVRAMNYARTMRCPMLSIVSRDGGRAKEVSDVCILIPVICPERVTPHAEEWQSVILHLIVNAVMEEERP